MAGSCGTVFLLEIIGSKVELSDRCHILNSLSKQALVTPAPEQHQGMPAVPVDRLPGTERRAVRCTHTLTPVLLFQCDSWTFVMYNATTVCSLSFCVQIVFVSSKNV